MFNIHNVKHSTDHTVENPLPSSGNVPSMHILRAYLHKHCCIVRPAKGAKGQVARQQVFSQSNSYEMKETPPAEVTVRGKTRRQQQVVNVCLMKFVTSSAASIRQAKHDAKLMLAFSVYTPCAFTSTRCWTDPIKAPLPTASSLFYRHPATS